MTVLWIGLTAFWVVGVAMVGWSSYHMGHARGQLHQITRQKPVAAPAAGSAALTRQDVMDLLMALEKIIDFANALAPRPPFPPKQVHH